MQSIFALADSYFVGRLGAAALGAVGAGSSLIVLVFALGFGLAMGAAAMVARRVGAGDLEGAKKVVALALLVTIAVSILVAIPGVKYASEMLRLIQTPETVAVAGKAYTQILFGTNGVILLVFLINGIFRGAGDPMLALKVLALANGLNLILDPILIYGWGPVPALGVTGAAVATFIGRGTGVLYQTYLLFSGKTRVSFSLRKLEIAWKLAGQYLRLSAPVMLQMLISTASWMVIFAFVGGFGEDAAAGYTIAFRLHIFALLPAWGMSNAAATLVGQNLGAKQPDQAERSVWVISGVNVIFLGLVSVVMLLFDESLVRLFSPEPGVIMVGASLLRYFSYTYIVFALSIVVSQSFNGAGDTWTPTWINFFCVWVFQLPLAYVLTYPLGWGLDGVFASISMGFVVRGIVGVLLFRRGNWKLARA